MFDWFRRFLRNERKGKCGEFFATIDAVNLRSHGGRPKVVERSLGSLELPSGSLLLGDPTDRPKFFEAPNVASGSVGIAAKLWKYPSGAETPIALTLKFGSQDGMGEFRKIGDIGIDGARIVLGDKRDIETNWTEVGKDRIGVFNTLRGDDARRRVCKRFKLKTRDAGFARAEVIGPVSEALALAIEKYLESIPKYSDYPFLYFSVETNNSFERANAFTEPYGYIPIGNAETPLMFICTTGRGDGRYDINCAYSGDSPCVVVITFVDDDN